MKINQSLLSQPNEQTPSQKKRGRPKGSKNKPKEPKLESSLEQPPLRHEALRGLRLISLNTKIEPSQKKVKRDFDVIDGEKAWDQIEWIKLRIRIINYF